MFVENYKTWGLKRRLIEALAEGQGGSKTAGAKARKILKAEKGRPPEIPLNSLP
jgi:hypothetical protein